MRWDAMDVHAFSASASVFPFGERLIRGAGHELRGLVAQRTVDHLFDELVDGVDEGCFRADGEQRKSERGARVRKIPAPARLLVTGEP
jgi:hypothetical protein